MMLDAIMAEIRPVPTQKQRLTYVDAAGKTITKTFNSEVELKFYADREKRAGRFPSELPTPTFDDAIAEYLKRQKKIIRTEKGFTSLEQLIDKYIRPRFPKAMIADVTPNSVIEFRSWVNSLGLESRHKDAFAALRGICTTAESKGWLGLAGNPFASLPKMQTSYSMDFSRRLKEIELLPMPSREEVAILINNSTGWLRTLILLVLLAGLRGQEVRALRWANVVFKHDKKLAYIRIVEAVNSDGAMDFPKTKAGARRITIRGVLYEHLRGIHDGQGDGDYVVKHKERRLTYKVMRVQLHNYQVKLGVGRAPDKAAIGATMTTTYAPHMLRHACVAMWIWARVKEGKMRQWIGHKSLQLTLNTYGYLISARAQGAVSWPRAILTPGENWNDED